MLSRFFTLATRVNGRRPLRLLRAELVGPVGVGVFELLLLNRAIEEQDEHNLSDTVVAAD